MIDDKLEIETLQTPLHNIQYRNDNYWKYYSAHRNSWESLYPSERHVLEHITPSPMAKVLDMGCACGGLSHALRERFGITNYTGVDINEQCIDVARRQNATAQFYAGDFLVERKKLSSDFDIGFSLSCADVNVLTSELLQSVYSHIRPGGHFIYSCRLTNVRSIETMIEGRQAIRFPGQPEEDNLEYTPYKVYRLEPVIGQLQSFGAETIYGYGYWGIIPETVVELPLRHALYVVFAVKKSGAGWAGETALQLNIPASYFAPATTQS